MKKNAYFQLVEREDGMYLQAFPAVDGGMPLTLADIREYLTEKNILDYDQSLLKNFVESVEQEGMIKLLDYKIIPESEYLKLTIDPEGLVVRGRFYPPSTGGKKLEKEDILDILKRNGVKFGIVEKNLQIFCLARPYCTDILLAKALKPVHGEDAKIEYHFDVNKTSKPALTEDGSVDFHNLDMIEKVEKDDLLATLTPETQGKPGKDVFGKVLRPRKVSRKRLRYGRNIRVSEDKLKIYSEVSGHVSLIAGTVFVSDVYEVPADVGPTTGDIQYEGNVLVKGNVLTGYKIQASGNITVEGVVEGAVLEADGNIILKRGMQGMGKGTLQAKGDIISKYIENAKVNAGQNIMADAIMHSYADAHGTIRVLGKRGLITGGELRANTSVEVKTLGSTMGTKTLVEVGNPPELIDRLHSLEAELTKNEANQKELAKTIALLQKKMESSEGLPEDKQVVLANCKKSLLTLRKNMDTLMDEHEEVCEEIDQSSEAKVAVEGTAYPGVKMIISNITYFVRTPVQYSRFVRDGADVRVKGLV